ncbi:MAG: archease, partial [Myxococcota bacterium]
MSAGGSFDFVEGATADLTLVARGTSLDEVFRAAAEALAAATVERVDAIEADIRKSVQMEDTDLDLLLLRFLNELIYLRDAEG